MQENASEAQWETLSREEKTERLMQQQIVLLNTFMERNAISREDYEKAMQVLQKKQPAKTGCDVFKYNR